MDLGAAGRGAETQWYSLRLEVIYEIRRTAQARRVSEDAVVHKLGQDQRQSKYSLDLLCKPLRAKRKRRNAQKMISA